MSEVMTWVLHMSGGPADGTIVPCYDERPPSVWNCMVEDSSSLIHQYIIAPGGDGVAVFYRHAQAIRRPPNAEEVAP